jgi:hypothetical protein
MADPEDDPELAMAIALSLAEVRCLQEDRRGAGGRDLSEASAAAPAVHARRSTRDHKHLAPARRAPGAPQANGQHVDPGAAAALAAVLSSAMAGGARRGLGPGPHE